MSTNDLCYLFLPPIILDRLASYKNLSPAECLLVPPSLKLMLPLNFPFDPINEPSLDTISSPDIYLRLLEWGNDRFFSGREAVFHEQNLHVIQSIARDIFYWFPHLYLVGLKHLNTYVENVCCSEILNN